MLARLRNPVGVVGMGVIGSRVAARLREASFRTYVWNRTPKPAPNFVGSPLELARVAPVIQLFVSDDEALLTVLEAMSAELGPRHTVVNHATVSPQSVARADRLVQDRKARFLNLPFTGSRVAAEKGQLVYLAGGPEAALDGIRKILEASSRKIIPAGTVEQAATLKLAVNVVGAATMQGLSEATGLLAAAQLAPTFLRDAIGESSMRSPLSDAKIPAILEGDYEPHFSLANMLKDIDLSLALAEEQELNIPLTAILRDIFAEGLEKGWGNLDFSAVGQNYYLPSSPVSNAPSSARQEEQSKEFPKPSQTGLAPKTTAKAPAPKPMGTGQAKSPDGAQSKGPGSSSASDSPAADTAPQKTSSTPPTSEQPKPAELARKPDTKIERETSSRPAVPSGVGKSSPAETGPVKPESAKLEAKSEASKATLPWKPAETKPVAGSDSKAKTTGKEAGQGQAGGTSPTASPTDQSKSAGKGASSSEGSGTTPKQSDEEPKKADSSASTQESRKPSRRGILGWFLRS